MRLLTCTHDTLTNNDESELTGFGLNPWEDWHYLRPLLARSRNEDSGNFLCIRHTTVQNLEVFTPYCPNFQSGMSLLPVADEGVVRTTYKSSTILAGLGDWALRKGEANVLSRFCLDCKRAELQDNQTQSPHLRVRIIRSIPRLVPAAKSSSITSFIAKAFNLLGYE